jgi:hypothetical protein
VERATQREVYHLLIPQARSQIVVRCRLASRCAGREVGVEERERVAGEETSDGDKGWLDAASTRLAVFFVDFT